MSQVERKETVWLINQDASTPETGYAGRSYYLGREMAKLGYNVYIVAASFCHHLREAPSVDGLVDIEHLDDLAFVRITVPRYSTASSPLRAIAWLVFAWRLRLLPKYLGEAPDIIVYSSPPLVGYLGAERLAIRLKAKLVFEVRDIWPLTLCEVGGYSHSHPIIRFFQWIEERAYKRSELVISNLKYSYTHMVRHGMQEKKFFWVPNGYLKSEVIHKEPLDEEILSLIPTDKFIVGYAGAIGRANNLSNVVEAAELCKSNDKIHFVIVGDGEERESVRQKIKSLGLKNVSVLGRIAKRQIQSLLACFDICYIGLKRDPLFRLGVSPNKLFDYMCAGKPIVYAVDSGGYDPVGEYSAGLSILPESPEELCKAVLYLFGLSQEERSKMGENARKLAEENYEYSQLAKRYIQILTS
ncbi:glycosyltransferase involved in cell wall biosynthesis [Halomonas fontilapidosi]|uniref:Glycosyltransferase involved in cell wall biosynthesis n=1 Tax=Halomonas fontilapidosi TaxID=616675 RepID=A0A7W5H0T5_9GAMM|nr:glycosyltransferase family 4 protein [Halomonas fontilapidosi]MBB3185657.1 glycosyltransferase involved in cell wall biosynthesis [Halomonas fontilapidosi]